MQLSSRTASVVSSQRTPPKIEFKFEKESLQKTLNKFQRKLIEQRLPETVSSYFPPRTPPMQSSRFASALLSTPQQKRSRLPLITVATLEKKLPLNEFDAVHHIRAQEKEFVKFRTRSCIFQCKEKPASASSNQHTTPDQLSMINHFDNSSPASNLKKLLKARFEPVLSRNSSMVSSEESDEEVPTPRSAPKKSRFLQSHKEESGRSQTGIARYLSYENRLEVDKSMRSTGDNNVKQQKLGDYSDELEDLLKQLQEHRLKHLGRVLECIDSMTPDSREKMVQETSQLFKMISNQFLKLEERSVMSLLPYALPVKPTSYLTLIQAAPPRRPKFDLRAAELYESELAGYKKEFQDEIQYNIYLVSSIMKKAQLKWQQLRLEQLLELEKVIGFVAQKSDSSMKLHQIVKFADEIRAGSLVGEAGGDFVKNGQSHLLKVISQELSALQTLMKLDLPMRDQIEMKKMFNRIGDLQRKVQVDDIDQQLRLELSGLVQRRKGLERLAGTE